MRGETYTCGLGDSFDGESLVVVYSHCDALVVVLGGLRLSSTPSLGRRKPIPHCLCHPTRRLCSDARTRDRNTRRVASTEALSLELCLRPLPSPPFSGPPSTEAMKNMAAGRKRKASPDAHAAYTSIQCPSSPSEPIQTLTPSVFHSRPDQNQAQTPRQASRMLFRPSGSSSAR